MAKVKQAKSIFNNYQLWWDNFKANVAAGDPESVKLNTLYSTEINKELKKLGMDESSLSAEDHKNMVIAMHQKAFADNKPTGASVEDIAKAGSDYIIKNYQPLQEANAAWTSFQNSITTQGIKYDTNVWDEQKLKDAFFTNYNAQGKNPELAQANTLAQITRSAPDSSQTNTNINQVTADTQAKQASARQAFATELANSLNKYKDQIPGLAEAFKNTAVEAAAAQEPELLRILKEAGVAGAGLQAGGVQAGIAEELTRGRTQAALSAADYQRSLLEQALMQEQANSQTVAQVGLTQDETLQNLMIQDYLNKFGFDAQMKANTQAQQSALQQQINQQSYLARENAKNRALQWQIANLGASREKMSKSSATGQGIIQGAIAGGSVGGLWGALGGGLLGGVSGYNNAIQNNSGGAYSPINYSSIGELAGYGTNYGGNLYSTYLQNQLAKQNTEAYFNNKYGGQ